MIQPKHIIEGSELEISGYDGRLISDHINIMYEAGLIEGYADRAQDGRLITVYPTRLTWNGHEFLTAAKNESAWSNFKDKLKSTSSSIPIKVAETFLLKYIEKEVGI